MHLLIHHSLVETADWLMITSGLNVFCLISLNVLTRWLVFLAMLSIMDILDAGRVFRSHSPLRSGVCLACTCVCKSHLTTKCMVCSKTLVIHHFWSVWGLLSCDSDSDFLLIDTIYRHISLSHTITKNSLIKITKI